MDLLDQEAQRLRIQADRIQQLKNLLAEPGLAALAREYLLSADAARLMENAVAAAVELGVSQQAEMMHFERKRGVVTEKVQAHVESRMDEYSAQMVIERMTEEGFKFVGQRPQVVVTDILRKLKEDGRVEVVQEGLGPKPALYRTIQKGGVHKVP